MPLKHLRTARLSFRISRYGVKGDESPRLPSGLPAAARGREGFPDMSRFALLFTEPEASFLTRQGISLEPYSTHLRCALERMTCLAGCTPTSSLHVAMQTGPSLHPVSWMLGVWPLRILMRSCLGLRRFIVWAISAISMRPL